MFKRLINWLARNAIFESHLAGRQQGFREGFAAGVEKIINDFNSLGSSKGKTADFEPANLGSIPSPRTKKIKGKKVRR